MQHRDTLSEKTEAKKVRFENRLIGEKSPYLLQHAHNPVDWYPWGEKAFKAAKMRDVPIFLSIGYSTCHWCHVMEKESFEDPEIARLMNDAFINIKVDREERPDIDNVYMTVAQLMTGRGGWPLTILMTPDKKPFFAATYIPRQSRFGLTGMIGLVLKVKNMWQTRRNEIEKTSSHITSALSKEGAGDPKKGTLGRNDLDKAFSQLRSRFDKKFGGFGHAPKFPTPHNFLFLLRYWKRTGEPQALEMVEKSLREMRQGGIYDHIGFGFHRYSTDEHWLLPHFEKMLYDQALLVIAYSEAYQATKKPFYAQTIREILTYVVRDMTDPQGGFYSAEDADSEDEEGKFYFWTVKEIRELLPEEDADWVLKTFNVKNEGNFDDETSDTREQRNIMHLGHVEPELSGSNTRWNKLREKLFQEREKRIHPSKDDKILTDWNGLMIGAAARAGHVLGDDEYISAARRSADFVLKIMRKPSGHLFHRYRQGEVGLPAHIDDYAFMIWGLLELYETTFESKYLLAGMELMEVQIDQFWDDQSDGFFFTGDDSEKMIVRQKEFYDGALPSGNSVSMLNLARLAHFTGKTDWEQMAAQLGDVFGPFVEGTPSAYSMFMSALDFVVAPGYEVVIVGKREMKDTQVLLNALKTVYLPSKIVLFRPIDIPAPVITTLAPFTKTMFGIHEKATAYVCKNYACELPTNDPNKMIHLLHNE